MAILLNWVSGSLQNNYIVFIVNERGGKAKRYEASRVRGALAPQLLGEEL